MPPFTDPVIDNAFLEFSQLRAVSYADRLAPVNQLLTATGEFGLVTVQMQASVHCSRGWEGTACEFLNNTQGKNALLPMCTHPNIFCLFLQCTVHPFLQAPQTLPLAPQTTLLPFPLAPLLVPQGVWQQKAATTMSLPLQ